MPINPCRNPQCEYFNKSLPNNAKVCPWCGKPLGNVFPAQDLAAEISKPAHSSVPHSDHSPDAYPSPYASPPAVRPTLKLIHAAGREFYLPAAGGTIGRRTQANPIAPEIDLAGIPDEGVVSRAHARIYWDATQNSYVIVDNASRNGTFLNGTPLKPEVPYRLEQDAVLQLGQDRLVNFRVVLNFS